MFLREEEAVSPSGQQVKALCFRWMSVAGGALQGEEQGPILNVQPEHTGGSGSVCASRTSWIYDGIWICVEWKLSPFSICVVQG